MWLPTLKPNRLSRLCLLGWFCVFSITCCSKTVWIQFKQRDKENFMHLCCKVPLKNQAGIVTTFGSAMDVQGKMVHTLVRSRSVFWFLNGIVWGFQICWHWFCALQAAFHQYLKSTAQKPVFFCRNPCVKHSLKNRRYQIMLNKFWCLKHWVPIHFMDLWNLLHAMHVFFSWVKRCSAVWMFAGPILFLCNIA